VKTPATEHEVTVGKITDWIESSGARSPKEMGEKMRLKEILTKR
jgi:hypothetical protein